MCHLVNKHVKIPYLPRHCYSRYDYLTLSPLITTLVVLLFILLVDQITVIGNTSV